MSAAGTTTLCVPCSGELFRRGAPQTAPRRPHCGTQRAQGTATNRWLSALNRRGARVRLIGQVRVDSPKARGGLDRRHRELPARGPGQYPPDGVRAITSRWTRNRHAVAEDLVAAFFDAYGFPDAEIESTDRLNVWPDGEREPR